MHSHPTVGEPQYVAKPVVDLLFPPGSPSRIPIIAVTGTNGKTTTARMIAHIFKSIGRKVGMTSTDGIVIDDRLVIREGRRTMPIAWVHQLPSTFEGRARMMVANAMAAAAAAHAAGAHLHDIRQGLRSFSTSIYQAPGRLNLFDLNGVKVLVDYAHNAHGLATVGDFVERMSSRAGDGAPGTPSWSANLRVAVIATPGDRRDEDMRELGRVAARYFDEIVIREDKNPRGRARGETADRVMEGVQEAMRAGHRVGSVEIVLDEMAAAQRALDRARSGDVVVLCVDYATEVWKELEARRSLAQPAVMRAREGDGLGDGQIEGLGGDPDLVEFEVGL